MRWIGIENVDVYVYMTDVLGVTGLIIAIDHDPSLLRN